MDRTPALRGVFAAAVFLGAYAPAAAQRPSSAFVAQYIRPIWALCPAESLYPHVDDRLADELGDMGLIPFPVSAVFSRADSTVVVLKESGEVEHVWKLPELSLGPARSCGADGVALRGQRFIFLEGMSFREEGGALWKIDVGTGEISRMTGTSHMLPEPSARAALLGGDPRFLGSRGPISSWGTIVDSAGVSYGLRALVLGRQFLGDKWWTVALRPDSALSKLTYAAGAAYRDVYSLRGALLTSVDTGLRGMFEGSFVGADGWAAVMISEMLPPTPVDSAYGRPFSPGRDMLAVVAPNGRVRSAAIEPSDHTARPYDIAFGRVLLAGWNEVRVVDLRTLRERAAFTLPPPMAGHRPGIVRSAVLLSDDLAAVAAVEPDSLPRTPYEEHRTLRVFSASGDVVAELEDWPGARLPRELVLGSQVQLLREPGGTILVNVPGIGAAIYPPVTPWKTPFGR